MARRPTREDLIQREESLANFFNSSTVGLAILNDRLCYEMLNPCLAASHGRARESHVGKHIREILGGVAPQVEAAMERVLMTAESVKCEVAGTLPTRPHASRWIASYFPIPDGSGKVKQVGAIVVEVKGDDQIQPALPDPSFGPAVLRSWKEIAHYTGACVKTLQRWERAYNFPVRRVEHKKGSVVFALKAEVDAWLQSRAGNAER
jgi:predicted DNA-binding transcriptional regulator AlpA